MRVRPLLRPALVPVALLITLAFCETADASQPFSVCTPEGRCGHVQPVDDVLLGRIAGRYAIAGEVVGMNLQMFSSWQAADGQKLESKATLSLSVPQSGHARVHLATQAGGTEAANIDAPGSAPPSAGMLAAVSGGAGLQGIEGVAQIVQIAGDGNQATNRARIDLVPALPAAIPADGQPNASFNAANGASASASISGNAIALRLKLPGGGIIRQQFNPLGGGHIQQAIQFAADRQQAMNQLQLQLQIRTPSPAAVAAASVGRALGLLRGK